MMDSSSQRQSVKDRYYALLSSYIKDPQEEFLASAADLGRELVVAEVPPEEIAELHQAASLRHGQEHPDTPLLTTARSAPTLLMELLMAYGMAYRERLETLRQTTSALRRSRERLQHFMDAATDMLLLLDGDMRCIDANATALKMLGVTREQVIGKHIAEATPEIYATDEYECYREVLRTGQPYAVDRIASDASRIGGMTLSIRVFKMGDGLGVMATDISERVRLEERLRQTTRMETVGRLASGVAHDFNNFLQVVRGYSEFLLASLDPDGEPHEFAGVIAEAAERAAALTRQLLAFSRQQRLSRRDLDLSDLVQNVLKMIGRVIGEQIELIFSPGGDTLTINADAGQIEQVLLNLCANARDAMSDGGRLTIETKKVEIDEAFCQTHLWAKVGRYALLSVTDTGHGMDEVTQSRIFEPFFTTKELGKGTGLGLATVHGIVRQHEGLIEVESAPEQGSTFRVYLPLVYESVAEEQAEQKRQPAGGFETILLAEDDHAVRGVTVRVLRGAGYHVLEAADGEAAMALIEERGDELDLVILDLTMPKKSGGKVIELLEARQSATPVICMSGYSTDVLDSAYLEERGVAFIAKPFGADLLLTMVRQVLDAQSAS